jgi:hypothetical protein
MGSLKWAVMCGDMMNAFRTGADRTVERAAIGGARPRRSSTCCACSCREIERDTQRSDIHAGPPQRGRTGRRRRRVHPGQGDAPVVRTHRRSRPGRGQRAGHRLPRTGAGRARRARERARLQALLGRSDDDLKGLNEALCERLAQGEVTLQTAGLGEHLWQTTLDKMGVDQPAYAAYRLEQARR